MQIEDSIHKAISLASQRMDLLCTLKDAAGLAANYTLTAKLMSPHFEIISGTEGIRRFWQTILEPRIERVTVETLEVESHGDSAVEIGTYTAIAEDGQVADRGTYLVVWQQEDGVWKRHRDIWNTNRPMQA